MDVISLLEEIERITERIPKSITRSDSKFKDQMKNFEKAKRDLKGFSGTNLENLSRINTLALFSEKIYSQFETVKQHKNEEMKRIDPIESYLTKKFNDEEET